MRVDARKEQFEFAKLFSGLVLFTKSRISEFTVPKGWHCYDVTGKSGDPVEPETIEKYPTGGSIGTILCPERIPFEKGKKSIDAKVNLDFLGEVATLEEFCTTHGVKCPADNRKFIPRPASPVEAGLFYALAPELDELLGGIGHLRMDFGYQGKEFWSRWFDHCKDKLKFNSEAGCFFCDCSDLELLKSCALRMKQLVGDQEQFSGLVKAALDQAETDVQTQDAGTPEMSMGGM